MVHYQVRNMDCMKTEAAISQYQLKSGGLNSTNNNCISWNLVLIKTPTKTYFHTLQTSGVKPCTLSSNLDASPK